ncbi:HigA family addiction module antidote protein [bacterium]|nr:HigA family addiction module antidote protein [bacterium]
MSDIKIDPLHPGEVLRIEFLEPMELSQNKLAIALHVPARRINEIVLGKRKITANTELRLARHFKMSPQFWLGLQMDYELDLAQDKFENEIAADIKPMAALG